MIVFFELLIFISCFISIVTSQECPNTKLRSPCECHQERSFLFIPVIKKIECHGQNIDDNAFNEMLVQIAATSPMKCRERLIKTQKNDPLFPHISEVENSLAHFEPLFNDDDSSCFIEALILNQTSVKRLNQTMFSFMGIKRIILYDNPSLEMLNPESFKASKASLEEIEIKYSNNLNGIKVVETFASQFPLLRKLTLQLKGLQKLPTELFSNSNFSQLDELDLRHNFISKIDDFTFYNIPNVSRIRLGYNNLRSISKNMFAFDVPFERLMKKKLYIDLDHNSINAGRLEYGCFLDVHRPIWLNLSDNGLAYLSQDIFGTFLFNDYRNMVDVTNNPIICDQRSDWIINNVAYINYLRGGEDRDVSIRYKQDYSSGNSVMMKERESNDYSYYKIRGITCGNGQNLFSYRS